jgi:hypothetical protein
VDETRHLTPEERGKYLEQDAQLAQTHERVCLMGQTQPPAIDNEEVDLHFVVFINHDGALYELDGRQPKPILIQERSITWVGEPLSLLKRACHAIRERYLRPETILYQYTILALVCQASYESISPY